MQPSTRCWRRHAAAAKRGQFEHAIKAFALLRRVIEGKTTEKGLREFLILLSICETCKYKSVDFLEFLRSDSKDVDDFANQWSKQRLLNAK